ncbi:MAG: universal stress protein [Acidobacteria bacterium]|nr:universal stress protein [Acidobacteriota bacterium]
MIQIKKILCPVDFFPASERALKYASKLATNYGAKLKLLHVVSPIIPAAYEYPLKLASLVESLEKSSRREIGRLMRKLKAPDVDGEVRVGSIYEQIQAEVESFQPDLIVMGTHGRRAFERWFLGSNTEHMLRRSSVPLLTISASGKSRMLPRQFKRILVTTDFSDGTADALNYAFSIAQENQSKLTLLHVVHNPNLSDGGPVTKGLEHRLDQLVPRDVRNWCDVKTRVDTGVPYQRILQIAKTGKFDLLVMNIHGKGMLDRALLGTTAERVVRAAACPVMLIPPSPSAKKSAGQAA